MVHAINFLMGLTRNEGIVTMELINRMIAIVVSRQEHEKFDLTLTSQTLSGE